MSSSKADAVARKVLGYGPTEKVPSQIITAITKHLSKFPEDDNFLLNLNDPPPFGSITCIEDNCNCDFNLSKSSAKDGGKALGMGSLKVYQDHIALSQAHRDARDRRVAVREARKNGGRDVKPDVKPHIGDLKPAAVGGAVKRPSLGGDDDLDVKKPKYALPALGERVNHLQGAPYNAAPQAATQATPAPAPSDRTQLILALQDQLKQKKKELSIAESTLVGIQASAPGNDPEHWNRLDATKKSILTDKVQIATLQSQLVQLGVNPAAPPPQQHQQANNSGNAVASGSGAAIARAAAALGNAAANAAGDALDLLQGGLANRAGSPDEYDLANGFAGAPGISHEDFNEFIRQAAEGADFEGNATVDEAARRLGLDSQTQCVQNMVVPLMPHQLIGVEWMLAKENSKHYGGILGDEMGLGKTVQTIACMAANSSKDANEKTTLIVAPLALLNQWKEEITSKMEDGFWRILIHHGSERAKTRKQIMSYDIVLTTYHTLASEWPDEEVAMKNAAKKKKKAFPDQAFDSDQDDDFVTLKKKGPLFESEFYRVVLDEAQNIRNRSTKISRAIARLDSLFRWCLTGTPITNGLADIYPLLRFLQMRPWFEWKDFNSHVTVWEKKRPELAGKRAQMILRSIMLRRKKDSLLDGKPLITLPPKVVELQVLEFSAEEREIYTFVETRSQATFNKYLKAGTVLKNYASVLVMLLRLRQLCLHPCLISDGFDALAKDAQSEQKLADELERAEKALGQRIVDRFRKERLDIVVARIKAEKTGEEPDIGNECPVCLDDLDAVDGGAVVTQCGHSFCRPCIEAVCKEPQGDEDLNDNASIKYKPDQRPCPNCRAPISQKMLFDVLAFDPSNEEISAATKHLQLDDIDLDAPSDEEDEDIEMGDAAENEEEEEDELQPVVKKSNKGKGKAVVLDSDDEDEEKEKEQEAKSEKAALRAKKAKDRELPESMLSQEPSTKMKWLLNEIQRIEEEEPDDKFLVLSQFTSALDICDDYLKSNGVRVTRFQGDMSMGQRDESVRILMKSKKCKVMLMSLKCGGVGLNLVRANRVINLDLGWSHAVEDQAFSRVHRIGQLKPVKVDRLTIANTVEQRIADMQDRKKGLADASLGEGSGQKLGKLTVNDLAALFNVRVV